MTKAPGAAHAAGQQRAPRPLAERTVWTQLSSRLSWSLQKKQEPLGLHTASS